MFFRRRTNNKAPEDDHGPMQKERSDLFFSFSEESLQELRPTRIPEVIKDQKQCMYKKDEL